MARRLIVSLLSAALLVAMSTPVAAQQRLQQSVTIRLHDQYGVPRPELDWAITLAGDALRRADVESIWRMCQNTPSGSSEPFDDCRDALGPTDLVVRIMAAPENVSERDTPASSLGYSLIDTKTRAGVLGTVFADRISASARTTHVDRRALLAWTVTHEIGHLLLGTTEHTRRGLMRVRSPIADLKDVRTWSFSRSETHQMAEALNRRASAGPANASVSDRRVPVIE